MSDRPTRVLIVDDSAVVRKLLADAIRAEPDMEVVGPAPDPFIARDLLLQHNPDVMTLDVEMPRMDGLSFLRRVMQHQPMPVIIVSSITQAGSVAGLEALHIGAIDVIAKPGGPTSVAEVAEQLKRRIRNVRSGNVRVGPLADVSGSSTAAPVARLRRLDGLVVVGASTGGTRAIAAVLSRLPADCPPILIVQHMPPLFTNAFAERLDRMCPMRVIESRGGEHVEPGRVYVAPGDRHLVIERDGARLRTALRDGPPVHYHRPAVDVLFHSAALIQGMPIVGVLLTGMGRDGADGMVALRRAGAETLAEDERSSVVFGMPREAIARGGATWVVALGQMPAMIISSLDKLNRAPTRTP